MGRKSYYLYLHCHSEGCKERSFYSYSTQRDYREATKEGRGRTWMCIRHSDDRLLTVNKLSGSMTVVSGRSTRFPDLERIFWTNGSIESGFLHSQSWKAYAEDFPIGTKITETVTVVLPGQTTGASDACAVNDSEASALAACEQERDGLRAAMEQRDRDYAETIQGYAAKYLRLQAKLEIAKSIMKRIRLDTDDETFLSLIDEE